MDARTERLVKSQAQHGNEVSRASLVKIWWPASQVMIIASNRNDWQETLGLSMVTLCGSHAPPLISSYLGGFYFVKVWVAARQQPHKHTHTLIHTHFLVNHNFYWVLLRIFKATMTNLSVLLSMTWCWRRALWCQFIVHNVTTCPYNRYMM